MLENRCEIALKIVEQDKSAEEVGIEIGAKDVPRQRYDAEKQNSERVKKPKSGFPLLSCQCPEKDAAARKNNSGGAFRESGKTQPYTEENECEFIAGDNCQRRILSGEHAVFFDDTCGAQEGKREARGEKHVGRRCTSECDDADARWKNQQDSPCRCGSITPQREPGHRKSGDESSER